jgi:hypothetical protein
MDTQVARQLDTRKVQRGGKVTRSKQKLRLQIGHAGSETRVGHTLTAKTSTADWTRRKRNVGWSHAHSKNFDCGSDTQEAKRGLVTRSQQKLRLRIRDTNQLFLPTQEHIAARKALWDSIPAERNRKSRK